ncbi:MAG TPA: hypothetical protein VKH37_11290, partial [Ferruginibacter sp.]|nr:hypothetical protein [Ferruginibacter sp.]
MISVLTVTDAFVTRWMIALINCWLNIVLFITLLSQNRNKYRKENLPEYSKNIIEYFPKIMGKN